MTDGAVEGLLEPTSVEVVPGEVTIAVGKPGHGNVALALALAGRLALTSGNVLLGADPAAAPRQRVVSLVDVPGVTEPDDTVPFRVVVSEELALAGLPAGIRAVTDWLRDRGLSTSPKVRMEDVAPMDRLRSLTELATARRGVQYAVVVSPDRHGLHAREWWPVASGLAERGLGVLVTVSEAVELSGHSARVAVIGGVRQTDRTAPVETALVEEGVQ